MIEHEKSLEHMNPYHDALGRFASKGFSTAASVKKNERILRNAAIGAGIAAGIIVTGVTMSRIRRDNYTKSTDRVKQLLEQNKNIEIPEIEIPVGEIITRFSTEPESSFIKDYTYGSFTNADRHRYEFQIGKERGKGSLFEINLKTNKPIRAPSNEKQFKMFNDLLNNDNTFRDALLEEYGMEYTPSGKSKPPHSLYKFYMGNSFYLPGKQGVDSRKSVTIFRDYAKKQGYNALIDVEDAGILADKPLYILDPRDNLSVQKVRKINKGMRMVNDMFLQAMTDPKYF